MHPITLTSKPSQVHPHPCYLPPIKRGRTTSNLCCLSSMEHGQTPSSQPLKETKSFLTRTPSEPALVESYTLAPLLLFF